MEKLMAHPLIDGGAALADASGVVVCIAGGRDLSLSEVNRVMEQINRQCEGANLILGAAIDEEMGDGLCVTLLAVKSGSKIETAGRGVEPQAPAVPAPDPIPIPEAPAMEKNSSRPASSAPPAFPPAQPGRGRKGMNRARQGQLALEMVSRGRFEKSEPTIHHGQDLDLPTYLRRGVALN
jgi:cell division protein FtsZ